MPMPSIRPVGFRTRAGASRHRSTRRHREESSSARSPIVLVLVGHVLAIAALPFVVAVVVPVWLARRNNVTLALGATALPVLAQIGGLFLVLIGLALFVSSLRRFASDGKGTLAPWDPPRQLVI